MSSLHRPLLPKATAAWLLENTALTFEQIGTFSGLHSLEIQALADGEVHAQIRPADPVAANQLTLEEIRRCEADPDARLTLVSNTLPKALPRVKGPRYTPVTKRGEKPDAIFYLIKTHPELSDAAICKLIGTTKTPIARIRDKEHWNQKNLKSINPVELGLCSLAEFNVALEKASTKKAQTA